MADFKQAVELTLVHEGGYVNNPRDSGGETNMGITQKDMPGQNMHELTVDQAILYFGEHYWKSLYSQISDQNVAAKLFDMGVLFGVHTAVKILQTSLSIVSDGGFGPVSLEAVNLAEPTSLLTTFKTALVSHVVAIVASIPDDRVFFAGWVRRINS